MAIVPNENTTTMLSMSPLEGLVANYCTHACGSVLIHTHSSLWAVSWLGKHQRYDLNIFGLTTISQICNIGSESSCKVHKSAGYRPRRSLVQAMAQRPYNIRYLMVPRGQVACFTQALHSEDGRLCCRQLLLLCHGTTRTTAGQLSPSWLHERPAPIRTPRQEGAEKKKEKKGAGLSDIGPPPCRPLPPSQLPLTVNLQSLKRRKSPGHARDVRHGCLGLGKDTIGSRVETRSPRVQPSKLPSDGRHVPRKIISCRNYVVSAGIFLWGTLTGDNLADFVF